MLNRIVRSPAAPYLLLTGLSLGTLFWGLGVLPFLGADECRYARIAQEMEQSGRWVTPLLEGRPWLEKPPLYYWITIPWVGILGRTEAAARIGPALLALAAAVSVLWLGRKLWSTAAGLLAGTILLTSVGFCAFGRSASPDMPVTACLTAAMSLMAAAVLGRGMTARRLVCAYGMLGLAILAKGPVALVLAALALVLFWVLDEEGGSLRSLRILPGLLVLALVSIPWHLLAFKENGFAFISVFFINHNLARFISDLHHHEEPFYYFLPVLLGLFFPWTGWLPALSSAAVRRRRLDRRAWDRRIVFLTCWALAPLLFFSFSRSKLPGYILPSLPPLALLLAARLTEWKERAGNGAPAGWRRWIYLAVSMCTAPAFLAVMWRNYGNAWFPGLMLAAATGIPAVVAFAYAGRHRIGPALVSTAAQGLLVVLAAVQFASPSLAAYHSARGIAERALAEAGSGEEIVTWCFFHHTLSYYTDYRIGPNLLDPPALLELAKRRASILVVTERDRLGDFEAMAGVSVSLIAGEGRLRLLRVTASSTR